MPNYKLTYFNGRGRAEAVRILFELAGVTYEDVRLEGAAWAELKPKTLFGQLPTLEIDGKIVGQSKAILRYVSREHGFDGSNSWETLEIDVVCELCDDLVSPIISMNFGGHDEEKKKELSKKYYDETAPRILGFVETVLCQNNEGSGFFVGDKISMADVVFLSMSEWFINPEHPDVLDAFPKLKALLERVKAQDKIAAWLKKRPVTAF